MPDPVEPAHAVEAALHLLRDAGRPIEIEVLAAALADHGVAAGAVDGVIDLVLECDGVATLSGDRIVDQWAALDGAHLAHRLSADELAHGVLVPGTDLLLLDALFDPDEGDLFLGEDVHLQDVHPVLDADLLALYDLPPTAIPASGGWLLVGRDLADAAPGDLLVVVIGEREATLLGPLRPGDEQAPTDLDELTEPAVRRAVVDAWRAAVSIDSDAAVEPSPAHAPVPLDAIILDAVVQEPSVLGPGTPPLSEVLERCGFVIEDGFVGPTGTDFALFRISVEVEELSAFYRLDQDQAVALAHLLVLFDEVKAAIDRSDPPAYLTATPDPDPAVDLGEDPATVLSWLADPDIASAFVSQAIGIRTDHANALLQFAMAARTHAPRSADVALLWLEAKALNRLGLALDAADRLDAAVRVDRGFVPLLLDAANLASDRGDAARAIEFARSAGLSEDDDFVRALREMIPTPPSDLGRNDPCYCGSGRKYKQCHLGRQTLGLDERASWLYRKALEWIQDTPWRLRLLEIATAYSPDEPDDEQILHLAMSEPFIADLAFSDDGAWSDFVADRGPLLPDDERVLAERWAGIDRSVFEVTAVRSGASVEVRDVRGDLGAPTVVVTERTFANHATVGDVILGRVLPAGESMQFFGGIIALEASEQDEIIALLDADASGVDLAAHLGSLRGGPRLTNTEGEPLVFCGSTFRIPDSASARTALDRDADLRPDTTRPTDGDAEGIEPFDFAWVEEITIDGRDWIRARFTLRANELVLEANSEARIARAQQRVEDHIAGAALIHTEQRPLDELADTAPIDPRAMLSNPTPELQAVMDEFARTAEVQWLDAAALALGGASPRQAADPTHPNHADLLGLLDQLGRPVPSGAIASGVDPDRLRALLGL